MRVLVTGAAGFIGSHLTRALAAAGHEVVALDIVPRAVSPEDAGHIEPVIVDVRDADAVANAMRGVEMVWHQAAMASVPASFDDPAACMAINSSGSANIFEQARLAGVKRDLRFPGVGRERMTVEYQVACRLRCGFVHAGLSSE